MKIAILGAGNVGRALGKRLSAAGHDVVYGVRDPQSAKYTDLKTQGIKQSATFADVVIIATPWPATESAIKEAGGLTGKIVIDCINPLKPDLSGLSIGHTDSAAEQIARWTSGAKVFKAFNQTGADNMAEPKFGDQKSVMFVAGDDPEGKTITLKIVSDVGFEAVDAGPLTNARLLEPLAMLWIYLAFHGLGRDFAFGLVKRP